MATKKVQKYHIDYSSLKNPVFMAFILSMSYWIYLFFTTDMLISRTNPFGGDSVVFERLGLLVHEKGWIEYFKTGPNREPLYPFIISISMRIADFFGASYIAIQKIAQIVVLFITQWLTYKILKKLEIHRAIILITILYFGFSPAIVNTAFSLFSEIATYPLILGIIFISVRSWQCIQDDKQYKTIMLGLCLAILFILITSVKAIFEFVLPIFLIPFFCLMISSVIKKKKIIFINSASYIVVALFIFQVCLLPYKLLNQKYNGNFAFTDRGTWLLYGNAAKRVEKLNLRRALAGLAHVPGDGVCNKLFGERECTFWSFKAADGFGIREHARLSNLSDISADKIDSELFRLAWIKILKSPFQYIFLTGIESLKMFFWESTKIGFVSYPPWLEKIFNFTLFKNGLRFFISLITLLSFFYLIRCVWQDKRKLFNSKSENYESFLIIFFILIFLFAYTAMYSLVTIITRYAIPLAPLYLVGIAYSTQKIIFKNQEK